ncbi:MAG: hypothetical protein ABW092_11935 [Candidatus Thiodiazotropha sp.]
MSRSTGRVFVLALFGLIFPQHGWAASITFGTFATTTDNPLIDTAPSVTVDDNISGSLTFNVTVPNTNGELSAVFIDLVGDPSYSASGLASLSTGVSIVDFMEDTNDIGNGRNLSGNFTAPVSGPAGTFDIGFGFDDGDNGGAGRQIALPFAFSMDDLGSLTLASIERIGLRFQSVGSLGIDGLGGGSEKLIAVEPVPLPAAAWLFGSAIVGAGLITRRKKKS